MREKFEDSLGQNVVIGDVVGYMQTGPYGRMKKGKITSFSRSGRASIDGHYAAKNYVKIFNQTEDE